MFHINRDFVRNAKPVNTNYPIKAKDTEYKRQYVPLRGSSNICPINKLPVVTPTMRNQKTHLVYRKSQNNWTTKSRVKA